MSKFEFEAAVAFAPQIGEGVANYDPVLDAVTTAIDTSTGLIAGVSGEGEGDTGLDTNLTRITIDEAVLAGSFTRPIGTKQKVEVSFSFVTALVGNRATASGTPADGEFVPIRGQLALLNGLGMVGSAWAGGVGQSWKFGSPNPISALVYVSGNRIEMFDCRVSGAIEGEAGGLLLLRCEVTGTLKEVTEADLPTTLDYLPQSSEKAPIIENVGFDWRDVRGFQDISIAIDNTIDEVGDSNAPVGSGGVVKEVGGRTVQLTLTVFDDDTADRTFGFSQVDADAAGDLEALSFQVGVDAGAADIIKAVQILAPQPEVTQVIPRKLGTKAGSEITATLRAATANEELELRFR